MNIQFTTNTLPPVHLNNNLNQEMFNNKKTSGMEVFLLIAGQDIYLFVSLVLLLSGFAVV